MEHELQLTPRGHAVCELMLHQGLTLESACQQVENQLEMLRLAVSRIMNERSWEDVPAAMQAVLAGVSAHVQSAYLEEQRRPTAGEDAAWLNA